MASSSSLTQIRRYHVFLSFHGPDVRRSFLSHLHKHFASKGITTFKDQGIERGHTIRHELVQAIRESRVSIVVLSKKYASSSWCLDELVEILKCKEGQGQTLMTVFYKVDPSDVQKQSGDFGRGFEKTCERKTEEEKQRWMRALTYVANIAGEHSLNWDDEAEMIEKIATDVSIKLNVTPSKDFDGMVGMETHLRKVNSCLRLECDEVKMIGIIGPAGIGKTTIARALFNQLSANFQLKCFMENLKGSYGNDGTDDYVSKLCLQSQLLSKILNQRDMKVHHLGAIKEWLQDQKVFIVLDDVDDLEQLDALAKEPSWFGLGSRIVITTEDRKILKAHWVTDIYLVDYPSEEEALEILSLYAFKQSSPWDGFEELAKKITNICGNLPLGLRVVGSSLRGESRDEWECQLSKLETSLDRKLENVLRMGYDKLLKKDQSLFLHIAFFFNNEAIVHVTTMLADSDLDVRNGLKTLADKSLVYVSTNGWITMHRLLQQLGRQVVYEQSDQPGKRQFLIEAEDIRNVLANETGTGSIVGISLDMSKIDEFFISGRAFEGMRNLRFLKIYGSHFSTLQMSENMEYLPRLRLLHWDSYPGTLLPQTFRPECLVEFHMAYSKLEKLWRGIQPLTNLKEIDLGYSKNLIEIPDLSKATSLKTLTLTSCTSLVELPSSIKNLHKLKKLMMMGCVKLQVVPTNINLASLEEVDMSDCSLLRSYPDISTNIKDLDVGNTKLEVHPSIVERLPRLEWFRIGSRNLKRLTHVPESVTHLDLSNSDIEKIPDCITSLSRLESLFVFKCRKLVTLQGLPSSLKYIDATDCGSLERVCFYFSDPMKDFMFHNCFSFQYPIRELMFQNCLNLDEESRRVLIQQRVYEYVCLPGKEVPAEFTHKTRGNTIIIPMVMDPDGTFFASSRFKACLLLSPIKYSYLDITCRLITAGGVTIMELNWDSMNVSHFITEHLFICGANLVRESLNVGVTANEIVFEFSCMDNAKIIECGVQILGEETESNSGSEVDYFETEGITDDHTDRNEYYEPEAAQCKYTCFWSWFKKLWSREENDDNKEENKNHHYDSKMMKKVFALGIALLLLYLVFP
ncbi:PREDICTED: disease resistance protein RML1A-like isoform X1 [Camelina sativa]|uniref:Disease resistance protein RML1A-like isoform X1 n=3 Tax=Camelina sativa TaxID=90675 RepID=A0ABM0UWZ8_CAMSA|nr:PREDICTED: disease resistance protein RML1A-like isoform X1 [Camelina sativa]